MANVHGFNGHWTLKRIMATGAAIIIGVPALADSLSGFTVIGEWQPFAFKSDMAAIRLYVSDQLKEIQDSLASARWDQAVDRADKWETDLQNMRDELVSKNVQKIAMEDRLKEKLDPLITETLRDLRIRIFDLERRITEKTHKLALLRCDLDRRDDPKKSCP